jgi:restriction system protein
MPRWSQYQEDVASFFRTLSLDAVTNVSVKGARTSHDVVVLVRGNALGLEFHWIVECKLWKTPVSKVHVMALKEIAHDLGADRGLVVAERGFQRGAIEAAQLTNITLTTMDELQVNSSRDIAMVHLQELSDDRIVDCRRRYWSIDKESRIELDLRPETGMGGYSAVRVLDGAMALLDEAFRNRWPVQPPLLLSAVYPQLNISADTPEELVLGAEPLVAEVEMRLASAETHFGTARAPDSGGRIPREGGEEP